MQKKYYDGFSVQRIIFDNTDGELMLKLLQAFADEPSAEVIEPKKGKWTKHAEAWSTWWTCSECGWDSIDCNFRYDDDGWYVEDVPMSFCPNCGAKMEGGENETD